MNENILNGWITWVKSNFIDNKKHEKKIFGQ